MPSASAVGVPLALAAAGAHHGLTRFAHVDVDIPLLAVLESLAGAACYATSTVLQQRAAFEQDDELSMRPGLLLKLVRSGRWMLGNVLDLGGFGFQLLALRHAALALVVPLFVSGLVFSIIGAAFASGRRPTRAEVGASSLVVAGLIVFISVSRPGPGHPHASAGGWVALFATTVVVVGACVVVAHRRPGLRALLLGVGTGVLYGVTASLTERTGHLLDHGIGRAAASWTPYALAVVAVLGLLLNQSAYQAGNLRESLPVLTVGEPIVAILIGQLLYGERIATTAGAIVGEVVGLAAVTVGVVVLSRMVVPDPAASPATPADVT
ncbi:MAG TPA: DMT family transporter [Acidimicrobiales bacterium]|nr:DMT family transporter [Acidimicrobiales bacterium]